MTRESAAGGQTHQAGREGRGRRIPALLAAAAITAAVVAVFFPAGGYEFINHDDGLYVFGNSRVREGLSWSNVRWSFETTANANWHPLAWLSHMLDVTLFGLDAGKHHLVNVAFHLTNSLALFLVLRAMTAALWRSALVAALFAVHPLHVESVAWVSERKDLLSSFFWMLTLAAYVRHVRRPGPSWYLVTLILFALGLMSKAMIMTLPVVLLLLDYWPLGRAEPAIRARAPGLLTEKVPFAILAGASFLVTFGALRKYDVLTAAGSLPVLDRVANAMVVYCTYVVKMLWPAGLALLHFQSIPSYPPWQKIAAFTVFSGVTFSALRWGRRHPFLPVGWFWYVVTLLPTVGLVHARGLTVADRYTYIPLVGLFTIAAWGAGAALPRSWRRPLPLAAAGLAAVALLSAAAMKQVRHWRDHLTVVTRAAEVAGDNARVQAAAGYNFLMKNDFPMAERYFRRSVRLSPGDPALHVNLGVALSRQGRYDEAIASYREALRVDPGYRLARDNLAALLDARRRGRSP